MDATLKINRKRRDCLSGPRLGFHQTSRLKRTSKVQCWSRKLQLHFAFFQVFLPRFKLQLRGPLSVSSVEHASSVSWYIFFPDSSTGTRRFSQTLGLQILEREDLSLRSWACPWLGKRCFISQLLCLNCIQKSNLNKYSFAWWLRYQPQWAQGAPVK